jgi:hypothetical protein
MVSDIFLMSNYGKSHYVEIGLSKLYDICGKENYGIIRELLIKDDIVKYGDLYFIYIKNSEQYVDLVGTFKSMIREYNINEII